MSSTELVDTHVHLLDTAFDQDREAVIERARAGGVTRLVEIADGPDDWERAVALCRARPATRASLGLHPYAASRLDASLLEALGRKARLPEVAAIGEIGLDYGPHNEEPPETQRRVLQALLEAAKTWDLPVVLHCRQAYPELLDILAREFPSPPSRRRWWGVVHCFSGTPEQAAVCSRLGFALGADGPVTYPKNDALRKAFADVGPSATVLETDSPYLPPQSGRGKRNEPSSIPEIARRLADVWRVSFDEAARVTTANARELFGLD